METNLGLWLGEDFLGVQQVTDNLGSVGRLGWLCNLMAA